MSGFSDAFDQVHADFVDLMIRLDLLPTDEGTGFSEASLARTILLAIELAEPDEQALLVSRIITDEETAAERLRDREVQDTTHRVVLDRTERRAALREDPSEAESERGNGEDCLICGESAHVQAPCGCNYCLSCYREAIRVGLRSQEEFPPKCCQPFDEAAIELARSPALIHLFRQMQEEAEAPVIDRLYCHDPNCATFIPPHRNGDCLLCDSNTCSECGGQAHPGRRCERGDAEEDVWATMDANRSVNCPGCGRMVTLSEACNHMTCPCDQEFCFICGKVWQTCNCPTYGGFERMVRMKHRPGKKPHRYRRRVLHTEATAANGADPLRIPQLRPMPGEENRAPISRGTRQRVIRPLRLPRPEERQPPEQRQREHENDEGDGREVHRHRHRHGLHRPPNHGVMPQGGPNAPLRAAPPGILPIIPPAPVPVRRRPRNQGDMPQGGLADFIPPAPLGVRHRPRHDAGVRRGAPYDPRQVELPGYPPAPAPERRIPDIPAMNRGMVRDNGPQDTFFTYMEQVRRGAISQQGGQRVQQRIGIEDYFFDNGNGNGGQYGTDGLVDDMAQMQMRENPAVMGNDFEPRTPIVEAITYQPRRVPRVANHAVVESILADPPFPPGYVDDDEDLYNDLNHHDHGGHRHHGHGGHGTHHRR